MSNTSVPSDLPQQYPIGAVRVQTSGLRRRIADIVAKFRLRPELKIAYVQAVTSPTITIRFIGTTTDILGVRCVGWGTITLPTVGQYVWVLHLEGGSIPIAIGVQ